jgi:hypothetical protein
MVNIKLQPNAKSFGSTATIAKLSPLGVCEPQFEGPCSSSNILVFDKNKNNAPSAIFNLLL